MHHKIGGNKASSMMTLDLDYMVKQRCTRDSAGKTVYEMYPFRWIAYFNTPLYTTVD